MCHVEKSSAGAFVKTGFWNAPRRQLQSFDEKSLSLYLLCCPERNAIGMFPLHFGEVASRTVGDVGPLMAALGRLVEQGEIAMEGYWIMVPSWWDHNHKPGPGHKEKIERTLAAAPSVLRDAWEANARAAGVFPFKWPEDEISASEGTDPTPGGTPRRTRGNNNDKTNRNDKQVTNTTTTTLMANRRANMSAAMEARGRKPYECIAFPEAAAEVHRSAFVRVCVAEGLSEEDARHLALELCARVESAAKRPEFQVTHHEPWMLAVVKKAREARSPILRIGTRYEQESAQRLKQIEADKAKSDARLVERQQQEQVRAELTRALQALDDRELADLADATDCLFPPSTSQGSRQRVRDAIAVRTVPTGLGQALLSRALAQRPVK